jgi:2'-5' RNA ligase
LAETAIVVLVPDARAAADGWRRAHTADGADGMPPHVTLLYPFVDDAALTEADLDAVREVVSAQPAFGFTLARFGEFPGVLYLAPDPDGPFRELTAALGRAFPEHPPYGGAFADVVPHLTLAEDPAAPLAEIRADVGRALPIEARADTAAVMRLVDGRWSTHARVPLRPS